MTERDTPMRVDMVPTLEPERLSRSYREATSARARSGYHRHTSRLVEGARREAHGVRLSRSRLSDRVRASLDSGDLVLTAGAGCGKTIAVEQALGESRLAGRVGRLLARVAQPRSVRDTDREGHRRRRPGLLGCAGRDHVRRARAHRRAGGHGRAGGRSLPPARRAARGGGRRRRAPRRRGRITRDPRRAAEGRRPDAARGGRQPPPAGPPRRQVAGGRAPDRADRRRPRLRRRGVRRAPAAAHGGRPLDRARRGDDAPHRGLAARPRAGRRAGRAGGGRGRRRDRTGRPPFGPEPALLPIRGAGRLARAGAPPRGHQVERGPGGDTGRRARARPS